MFRFRKHSLKYGWIVISYALLAFALPSAAQDASATAQSQPPPKDPQAKSATQTPDATQDQDTLRKQAQNPVASLISVPIQENFNFNISPNDRTQNVMNIQPVIPARLTDSWNLITRVIAPVIYQPLPPVPGQATQQGVYGLGDLNPTFFFSPSKPSKLIWGVGPAMVLPTATSQYLGQGKWSMGPSV
ncbi:MAG TPA: hypothetical protein VMH89_14045, partial [Candidatus Acidoferrum sp.]|nr:hypothetical protein [Candidatus Acidoferrum sp.]